MRSESPGLPRLVLGLSRIEAASVQAVPQASSILASLGQAAFVWDLAADTIAWSDNAAAVFPDIPMEALVSGAEFAKLIEPARSIRTDALGQTGPARGGEGVAYRIEYGVRASTSAPVIWIEETGCWFADADGRPVRAQGIVRVDNERHAREKPADDRGIGSRAIRERHHAGHSWRR